MASQSVTITDTFEAIKSGIIPGKIIDGHTFTFTTLTYQVASGAQNTWEISVTLYKNNAPFNIDDAMLRKPCHKLSDEYTAKISVKCGKVGGKIRDSSDTIITEGKNIGRSNETNCLTQAIRDALGKYNKQLKVKGPTDPIADVKDMTPPPMLVAKEGAVKSAILTDQDFVDGIILQHKFNGVRCVITILEGKIFSYSRTGREYMGLENIKKHILDMLTLCPGVYFDGELYKHGKPLNWISGQARKEKDDNLLEYHIYDLFFVDERKEMISEDRQMLLSKIIKESDVIKRVPNYNVKSKDEIIKMTDKFIKDGYEGGIVRKNKCVYQHSYNNYHSPNIIKIKYTSDAEYPIIGFSKGVGVDEGAIIWRCAVTPEHTDLYNPDDCEFNVVPKIISKDDRRSIYSCMVKITDNGQTVFDRYIKGLPLTVQYSELSSKTGIPQQAKAICVRSYENGPDLDPIAKFLSRTE
jgi:hypothetical protein